MISAFQYEYIENVRYPQLAPVQGTNEIFIPSQKVFFNSKNIIGNSDNARNRWGWGRQMEGVSVHKNPMTEISLPSELVDRIVAVANAQINPFLTPEDCLKKKEELIPELDLVLKAYPLKSEEENRRELPQSLTSQKLQIVTACFVAGFAVGVFVGFSISKQL